MKRPSSSGPMHNIVRWSLSEPASSDEVSDAKIWNHCRNHVRDRRSLDCSTAEPLELLLDYSCSIHRHGLEPTNQD